jgi:hypothetical protein
MEESCYAIRDLWVRKYHGFREGKIESTIDPTGVLPECTEQLREHGVELPTVVYEAAERRQGGPK